MLRPAPKDAVQAQNRVKLRMILAATEPNRALLPIERIVGHHDVAHTSDLKHFLNEALYRLRSEETPRVDSEMGLFSTNNACQIASARSLFESCQYSSGVLSEERKNSASR